MFACTRDCPAVTSTVSERELGVCSAYASAGDFFLFDLANWRFSYLAKTCLNRCWEVLVFLSRSIVPELIGCWCCGRSIEWFDGPAGDKYIYVTLVLP